MDWTVPVNRNGRKTQENNFKKWWLTLQKKDNRFVSSKSV